MGEQKYVPMGTQMISAISAFNRDMNRIADYVDQLETAYMKLKQDFDQIVAERDRAAKEAESSTDSTTE